MQLYGGGLSSISDDAVFSGGNAAAVQRADGAWEVMQFANAVLVGERTFLLSRFLRGQAGSEQAIGGPLAAGAPFVLFDDNVATIASGLGALERSLQLRIVAVSDCVAESARFRFDAPSRASLALSAGLVRADGSEDAEGDGVLAERRIAQPGNALVLDSGATCAVRGRTCRGAALALPALICGLMWRRRRAARLT